jgi:hypothetical protein
MDLFATKLWASAGRSAPRDFFDLVEFIRRGYSLEKAFSILLAIFKTIGKSHLLRLDSLRNDFLSGSAESFLGDREACEILRSAAEKVSLDRVFKSRIKIDTAPFGSGA